MKTKPYPVHSSGRGHWVAFERVLTALFVALFLSSYVNFKSYSLHVFPRKSHNVYQIHICSHLSFILFYRISSYSSTILNVHCHSLPLTVKNHSSSVSINVCRGWAVLYSICTVLCNRGKNIILTFYLEFRG